MDKFLRYLSGYVLILIQGEQTERFLNLCKGRGIVIRSLIRERDDGLQGILSVRDFFLLQPIHRKTGVHIHILAKHGLPFFFYRNKKRKAFFLGVLLCFLLMAVLSGRIWNIHIQGNVKNSTPQILEFLARQDIVHGIPKSRINCSDLASKVRKRYPEITWVSAKIEGTRLILTIQEGQMQEITEEEKQPCNLVAEAKGTIVKMITRQGIPVAKPGDTCKPGDMLVLGRLDLKNDSQEVFRYEYTHADADVYVKHKLSYYREFPLSYKEKVCTGKEKQSFYLKIGKWYMEFGRHEKENWQCITEESPWRITENFTLPVSLGKISQKEYEIHPATYTKEEAQILAAEKLHLYEDKLLKKGIQITETNLKTEITPTTCTTRGTLTVIEKTGRETPVTKETENYK